VRAPTGTEVEALRRHQITGHTVLVSIVHQFLMA
jgi:hypothetical protein